MAEAVGETQTPEKQPGMSIYECWPQDEGCVKLSRAHEDEYVLQLAADINHMEGTGDQDGVSQIWQNYGNRDSILACHIIERHPELMPRPRVD